MWRTLGITEVDWRQTPPAVQTKLLSEHLETHSLKLRSISSQKQIDSLHQPAARIERLNQKIIQQEKRILYLQKQLAKTNKLANEDNSQYMMRMLMVGFYYFASDDNEKTLEYFNKAMEVARAENEREAEAMMLMMIGFAHGEKQPQIAIDNLKKAEEIADSLNMTFLQTSLNFIIGVGYAALYEEEGGKNQQHLLQATKYLNRALTAYQAAEDKNMEAFLLSLLMEFWEDENLQLATIYGKQAVNAYQNARTQLRRLDKNLQDSYLQKIEEQYRKLVDLLIKQGRLPEAQTVMDLLKEGEYKQLLRAGNESDTIPYSQTEASIIKKIEKLVALQREQSEILKIKKETNALSKEQESRLAQLRDDIAAANTALNDSLISIAKTAKNVAPRVDEILSGRELKEALRLLGEKTRSGVVALYTVLGTEESENRAGNSQSGATFGWVIMIRDGASTAYPINTNNLEELVFQFRRTLISDRYNPQPLAEKIYQAIFRQPSKQNRTLEQDLQDYFKSSVNKTVMWSLDGVLRYIPMSALHDGKQYLVENYRNTVFTNTSKTLLTTENKDIWRVLGLGISEQRENFSALPGVKTELETIVSQPNGRSGIFNGVIKLNNDFREQEFFNSIESRAFTVAHIATHYRFDIDNQNNSFLLTGDGHLTFGEIKQVENLFGGLDLLTLSACDTGVAGNGKEAEGFAFLAQELGAKSVIASLWKVSDAGTPELMTRFYQLRKENLLMPKGEAFRQAQLSLLNAKTRDSGGSASKRSDVIVLNGQDGELPLYEKDAKHPFAHPHFWSSFVLIGNWK